MAVVPPMPMASVSTAVTVKIRAVQNWRSACRMSAGRVPTMCSCLRGRPYRARRRKPVDGVRRRSVALATAGRATAVAAAGGARLDAGWSPGVAACVQDGDVEIVVVVEVGVVDGLAGREGDDTARPIDRAAAARAPPRLARPDPAADAIDGAGREVQPVDVGDEVEIGERAAAAGARQVGRVGAEDDEPAVAAEHRAAAGPVRDAVRGGAREESQPARVALVQIQLRPARPSLDPGEVGGDRDEHRAPAVAADRRVEAGAVGDIAAPRRAEAARLARHQVADEDAPDRRVGAGARRGVDRCRRRERHQSAGAADHRCPALARGRVSAGVGEADAPHRAVGGVMEVDVAAAVVGVGTGDEVGGLRFEDDVAPVVAEVGQAAPALAGPAGRGVRDERRRPGRSIAAEHLAAERLEPGRRQVRRDRREHENSAVAAQPRLLARPVGGAAARRHALERDRAGGAIDGVDVVHRVHVGGGEATQRDEGHDASIGAEVARRIPRRRRSAGARRAVPPRRASPPACSR